MPLPRSVDSQTSHRGQQRMKHLLSGVAMAAALAIAAPVMAQNTPMTPSAPKPAASAPAKPTATAKKPVHRVARKGPARGSAPGNSMTDQLNQQELQRIQTGSPPSMPAAGGAPGAGAGMAPQGGGMAAPPPP